MPTDPKLKAEARRLSLIASPRVREQQIYRRLVMSQAHKGATESLLAADEEIEMEYGDGLTPQVNRWRRSKNALLVLAGMAAVLAILYGVAALDRAQIPRPVFTEPTATKPPQKAVITFDGKPLREIEAP